MQIIIWHVCPSVPLFDCSGSDEHVFYFPSINDAEKDENNAKKKNKKKDAISVAFVSLFNLKIYRTCMDQVVFLA